MKQAKCKAEAETNNFSDCFNFVQKKRRPNTYTRFLKMIVYFGTFHMCDVRDCASSAKSVVIVFDDRSDVSEKTMKVTVPT